MQGAAPAKNNHGKFARVIPTLHGDGAHCKRHFRVGDAQNAQSRVHHRQAQGLGNALLNGLGGQFQVQVKFTAQKPVRVEPPRDQIGIGDRGLCAATAITGWPWRGASTARADLEGSALIDPCHRAATGTHLNDVHHGQAHGMAMLITPNEILIGHLGHALFDQTSFGGGAAHVKGNHVGLVEQLTQHAGPDDAARRPRLHHAHRNMGRSLRGHDPTVGLHDHELALEALLAQRLLQGFQVLTDLQAHIGIEHGGGGAFIFAVFAQNFMRQGDEVLGKRLAQQTAQGFFMCRVGIGVQQAHRNSLHIGRCNFADHLAHTGLAQGCARFATGGHALGHPKAQGAWHQGLGFFEKPVVGVRAIGASHLIHIGKTFGGDQGGACTCFLDHGIDGHGRAMNEML